MPRRRGGCSALPPSPSARAALGSGTGPSGHPRVAALVPVRIPVAKLRRAAGLAEGAAPPQGVPAGVLGPAGVCLKLGGVCVGWGELRKLQAVAVG